MKRILIADDDREFSALLIKYLAPEGFEIDTAYNGMEAVDKAMAIEYDLVILDVMMPILNGFDSLKRIRENIATPVIMLTARGEDVDRIVGLEMGADDYLAKPCNPRELLARIRAIFRRVSYARSANTSDEIMEYKSLILNPRTHSVQYKDKQILFTCTEFDLLKRLMQSPEQIVKKSELSEKVLERKLSRYDRSIDMHISNIRKKLEQCILKRDIIRTVRGVGFVLTINEDE